MDTIELNGRRYSVTIEADDDCDPPWKRDDGHGPVTAWTSRDKQPEQPRGRGITSFPTVARGATPTKAVMPL